MATDKELIMSNDKNSALPVGVDLTNIKGRQNVGLPEIVPIGWLRLDPGRAEQLNAIADVDFTSSTGMMAGRNVSPWPLLCASLAAVEAEHDRIMKSVATLRNSVVKVKDMPMLYAEAVVSLDRAEGALLKSSQRLPLTFSRTVEAISLVAEHLYEAGFVARPGVVVQPEEGPNLVG
jgi:hypothetical protein